MIKRIKKYILLREFGVSIRDSIIKEINKLTYRYKEKLFKRIFFLYKATLEEYPDEELISFASLEGLLKFISNNKRFIYPDITITPDGNVRAKWQKDNNHHLAIEFTSDSMAKFVVFAPDSTYPIKVARITGIVSIDSIISSIEPYKVLEWSTE